jgi:uncharacterized protein (DUF1778 family)
MKSPDDTQPWYIGLQPQKLELSPESLKKIQDLIDNPPQPSARLREAVDNWKKRCKL